MPQRTGEPGELVTIPGVELARTGTWDASTGKVTFTREDFESAVQASLDPAVWEPPVKIGHTDPRFAELDGEPALGWVGNLSVVDNGAGHSLYGDLVDVPAAVAPLLKSAYKKRSIELAYSVKTPAGQKYRAAVVGLALLGATKPAVSGLADVMALYGADSTHSVAAAASESQVTIVYAEAAPALSLEERVALLEAGSPGAPGPVTHLRSDVANATGGGPVAEVTNDRIREILKLEADADLEAAITALHTTSAAAAVTPPAPTGTPAAPAPAATVPPAPTAAAPAANPTGTPADPATAPTGTPAAPAAVAPTGTPVPDGFTLIDTATLQQVTGLIAEDAGRKREMALASAARTGRISPASVESWRAQYDRDPEGTVVLLSALPIAFPTVELGHADPNGLVVAAAAGGGDDKAWDDFYSFLEN